MKNFILLIMLFSMPFGSDNLPAQQASDRAADEEKLSKRQKEWQDKMISAKASDEQLGADGPVPPTVETALWSDLVGVSKDRSKIVFAVHDRTAAKQSGATQSRALWLFDIHAGRIHILEEGCLMFREAWKYLPDSEKVLYFRRDKHLNASDLYVVDLKGEPRMIASWIGDIGHVVSPNERFVAYLQLSHEDKRSLGAYIASIDNPAQRIGPFDFKPLMWSKDSSKLLVRIGQDLALVNSENGRVVSRLDREIAPDFEILDQYFSPSSDYFCFRGLPHDDDGASGGDILVASVNPLSVAAKLDGYSVGKHGYPHLSWDDGGRYIVPTVGRQGSNQSETDFLFYDIMASKYFSATAHTSVPFPYTKNTPELAPIMHYNFVSLPDSGRIMYIAHEKRREVNVDWDVIWLIDLNGRKVVQQFRDAFYPHRIVASPDGKYLAARAHYVSGNDDISHGWILNVETGERTRLDIESVVPVVWLDAETVLWASKQPMMGKSIPPFKLHKSRLGEEEVEQVFPIQ